VAVEELTQVTNAAAAAVAQLERPGGELFTTFLGMAGQKVSHVHDDDNEVAQVRERLISGNGISDSLT
jgi:hypothetical protein